VTAIVLRRHDEWVLHTSGLVHRLGVVDPLRAAAADEGRVGRLTAPMPAKVVAVKAVPGQAVERGALLIGLEAMKMEHGITAPAAGTIAAVKATLGDRVEAGAELIVFETEHETASS